MRTSYGFSSRDATLIFTSIRRASITGILCDRAPDLLRDPAFCASQHVVMKLLAAHGLVDQIIRKHKLLHRAMVLNEVCCAEQQSAVLEHAQNSLDLGA